MKVLGECFGHYPHTVDKDAELTECTCHREYIMLHIDGASYALTPTQAATLANRLLGAMKLTLEVKANS